MRAHSPRQSANAKRICNAKNADPNAAGCIQKRGIEEILKQANRGSRESARGGTHVEGLLRHSSKPKVQTQGSENRSNAMTLRQSWEALGFRPERSSLKLIDPEAVLS